MGNKIKVFLMRLYLITILCIKYRIKADKKFRVVQTAYNSFELQKYDTWMYSSKSGLTGGVKYKWITISNGGVSDIEEINREYFKSQCMKYRDIEYHKLCDEYEEEINKLKPPKYPKVIY